MATSRRANTSGELDVLYAGVVAQSDLVRSGQLSSRELTELVLERIARVGPCLNATTVVMAEQALDEAERRDVARAAGQDLPLLGVPIAIKDELDIAGQVTTFGGSANITPATADAELVRRLRAAGAVIVAKTAMPEFGQWPFTESSTNGYTRNPWDTTRTTGGSSGGSAAAVAAGLVSAATGGDGGGSIRGPSACCGTFGLKPQRGRLSTAPETHLWHALGVVGVITRRVADAALLYDVARGNLATDRFRAEEPRTSFVEAARTPPGRLRIAVSTRGTTRGVKLVAEQARALQETAKALRELGHEVHDEDPDYPDATMAFMPQYFAGVAHEARLVERPDLLERRTKQMLALARLLPSRSLDWSIRRGERIGARVNQIFDNHELLITPAIPEVPRSIGALDGKGAIGALLASIPYSSYLGIWNLCGNPAASVPAGFTAERLPLAVQLVGRPHDEPTILQVAAQLEQARPWAGDRPPVE